MRPWFNAIAVAVAACTPPSELPDISGQDTMVITPEFPAPDAWGPRTGPGAPQITFDEAALYEACAPLPGLLARDADHHDNAIMVDGYLIVPWSPEEGIGRLDLDACGLDALPQLGSDVDLSACAGQYGGGITLWDISNPCAPIKVGEGWTPWMRETHNMAYGEVDGRRYVTVNLMDGDGTCGLGLWDITDPTAPFFASYITIPGTKYPDSYTFITWTATWQGPYIYVPGSLSGVHVIDASDPLQLKLAMDSQGQPIRFVFTSLVPQVGSLHVWGNRALLAAAGIPNAASLDLSDPLHPQPAFGGKFLTPNAQGRPSGYYFSNLGATTALFANSPEGGGGLVIFDITDPEDPTLLAAATNLTGGGGYVFQHENLVFEGDSNFATIYDITDPTKPTSIATVHVQGDFDFLTPIGNIAVASVDEDAAPGHASQVIPWRSTPDDRGPRIGMTSPVAGQVHVPLTSRIGIVFDEMVDPVSVFTGSFRVFNHSGEIVEGQYNVQENVVNFTPRAPLQAGTTYYVEIPNGGIIDLSGNAMAEPVRFSFTTVAE